jgi:hypothetical protein
MSDLTTPELSEAVIVGMAELFDRLLGEYPGPSAPDVGLSLDEERITEGRRRLLTADWRTLDGLQDRPPFHRYTRRT